MPGKMDTKGARPTTGVGKLSETIFSRAKRSQMKSQNTDVNDGKAPAANSEQQKGS